MTTEEMNTLDREVAELMGIPILDYEYGIYPPGASVCPHFKRYADTVTLYYVTDPMQDSIPWQPTRDPRCERIVEDWLISQEYCIQKFRCHDECHATLAKWYAADPGNRLRADTPGIALCLAVVEAFGGEKKP